MARRHRCACKRALLGPDDAPVVEATSTVDRIRHARGACEPYRTMERRQLDLLTTPPLTESEALLAGLEERMRALRERLGIPSTPLPPPNAPAPPRHWSDRDEDGTR